MVELSFSGFCKIAACVNLDVTLKGLRGVENAARCCRRILCA